MHGSVNILNTIELDTQKMVKMVKLLFCVLITHMYTHTHTHTQNPKVPRYCLEISDIRYLRYQILNASEKGLPWLPNG